MGMEGRGGVGKSTVGHLVAQKLGYSFINTGEMYRALTWVALKRKVPLSDARALADLAGRLKWEFRPMNGVLKTFVDGRPVGQAIRAEKVGRCSSQVAAIPGVRRHLRRLQRRLGRAGGVVMEGRDITTDVFPDADLKFYLDASIEERALRRYRQLRSHGKKVDLDHVKEWILKRDFHDIQRAINPLRKAMNAVVVDSTHLTLRQVAQLLLKKIRGGHG